MAAIFDISQELGQIRKSAQNESHQISSNEKYLINRVVLMIKVAFLTVKDTYFENKSVILGNTEGPLVPKVREAICYFSVL